MPYFEVIKSLIARYPGLYIKIMEIAEELTMTKPNGISLPPGTFEKMLLERLPVPVQIPPPNYVIPDNPFCSGGGVYTPRRNDDPWW